MQDFGLGLQALDVRVAALEGPGQALDSLDRRGAGGLGRLQILADGGEVGFEGLDPFLRALVPLTGVRQLAGNSPVAGDSLLQLAGQIGVLGFQSRGPRLRRL